MGLRKQLKLQYDMKLSADLTSFCFGKLCFLSFFFKNLEEFFSHLLKKLVRTFFEFINEGRISLP